MKKLEKIQKELGKKFRIMFEQKSEIPNNNVPIKLIIKIADFGI